MVRGLMVSILVTSLAAAASAQTTDAGPGASLSPSLAQVAKVMHTTIRRNIAEAAESMPAEDYAFKPTPQVRSFSEVLGHIAFANYLFCSSAKGEASPVSGNLEALQGKPAMLKAVLDSLAYCDSAYEATTDANFNQAVAVTSRGATTPTVRGAVLMYNTTHNNEHYGNLVVYMRIRGHVPPSTARVQPAK